CTTTYSPSGAPGSEVVNVALLSVRDTTFPKVPRAAAMPLLQVSWLATPLESEAARSQLSSYWPASTSAIQSSAARVAAPTASGFLTPQPAPSIRGRASRMIVRRYMTNPFATGSGPGAVRCPMQNGSCRQYTVQEPFVCAGGGMSGVFRGFHGALGALLHTGGQLRHGLARLAQRADLLEAHQSLG